MAMGKRVLVVDDEPDALDYVKVVLEAEDFEVHTADGAEKGLEAAKQNVPDLMILDVQMPGKDGFWLYNQILHTPELSGVKVVMLTGVSQKTGIGFDGDLMKDYFGRGPAHYVEKPVDPANLVETVRRTLGLAE